MKPIVSFSRIPILVIVFFLSACQKEIKEIEQEPVTRSEKNATDHGHLNQTKTFSSEVAQKWQDLQMRFLRLTGGNIFGMNGNRYFAYLGIGLYEAVVPGMPSYQSLHGQLTDMPVMPKTEPGKAYYWPASANAVLAELNRKFYTVISSQNKLAIDSLEAALNAVYQTEVNSETFLRSVNFGKEVANLIFNWSVTDGSLTTYPAYSPAPGAGLWSPTAPNPATSFAPYWGLNRLFVQGSLNGTDSPLPPPYSTDPNSDYFAMVKEVYDISQTLTPAQQATALYFRDNPGFQSGTHYISIFNQVMNKEDLSLDKYAVAHARTGIAIAESQIGCWKLKYSVRVDRPIRYIRNVMGHTAWNPLLSTPPHPEFPSGHSQTGGALAAVMTSLFGDNYSITLHTYDNLGMSPRSYQSFFDMVDDIGMSRVYAGIHYRYTCVESTKQGARIANNILNALKFKKE